MKYQVNPQFVARLNTLVQEVLSDEARFFSRNDQTMLVLHNRIFSKSSQNNFQSFTELEKNFFRRYFYSGGGEASIREDVPFAESPEDQAFFFDQLRTLVQTTTYNYDRMDFLRPHYEDEKATTAQFDSNQVRLITQGLVYPCLAALEQRQIAKIEKQKSGTAADNKVETDANPYQNLGNKVMVKGLSGEFDQVLTYDQLELLAAQETLFRSQNLTPDQVARQLREYAAKTFPGLTIAIDEQGNIQTFLGAAGLSASGLPTNKADQPPVEKTTFSELIKEMKLRQGRQMQYDSILSSNGNLTFSTADFQVKNANGITTTVDGLNLMIDQAGQGNTAVFFLTDKKGTLARFSIDIAAVRNGENPPLNIAIYRKPEEDNPTAPKIKVDSNELEKLKKPLLELYALAQAPNELDKTGEIPKSPKLPTSEKPGAPIQPPSLDENGQPITITSELNFELPKPHAIGYQPNGTAPKPKLNASGNIYKVTSKIKPKIQVAGNASANPTAEEEEKTTGGTQPIPPQLQKPKKTVNPNQGNTSPKPAKPGMPKVMKAMAVSSIPIAATIITGLFVNR